MSTAFLYGAGGASPLNFKVTGGTAPPASPAENTIWVETDIAVTGWEFGSAPSGALGEGSVFFETGEGGDAEFNALKSNRITLCPTLARQRCGGEYVSRAAQIYKNGAWVDLITVLFPGGEFSVVGANASGCSVGTAQLSIASTTSKTNAAVCSADTIDCSKYKRLRFTVSRCSKSGNGQCNVGVNTSRSGNTLGSLARGVSVGAAGEYTVDISDITAAEYVVACCWGSTGAASFAVTRIVAE